MINLHRLLLIGTVGLLSSGTAPSPTPAPASPPATAATAAPAADAPAQEGEPAYGPPRAMSLAYVDPTNGFSMGVPAFAGRSTERSIAVWFQAPPENGFSSNVNVVVDPVKTTRADYVAASLATLKKTNPGARFHERRELQVSGHEAEILDYDISLGGRRLRFLQLLVVDEDAAYVVTCTSPLDRFGAYEPEFRHCIDSFRLLRNISE